ncbi:MAG: zinc dependent phospholipase C family protein [Coriobacteriales bacterium]|jgi:hypothetical protein|nr:zinc dependent phospholipase C family protein [Coriobacteriales bacterium]
MPALLSHHLFGRALLARANNRTLLTREARDAFLLGNQGPDPLYFATLSPRFLKIKSLGAHMHSKKINEYFSVWRDMLNRCETYDHHYEVLKAYVYGAFCHYFLDRETHPFVRAQVEALCNAGVEGLEPRDKTIVHAQIETDLDTYMLTRLTGRTLEEYCIPKQMLYSSDAALSSIDTLYTAAAELYPIKVPRTAYTQSIKDMRLAEKLLYSPGGTKRMLYGHLERLGRQHSLIQAISHSNEAQHAAWHANESKAFWHHPDTKEKSNKTFAELFDDALTTAVACRALFESGAPLSEITKGLDYYGSSINEEDEWQLH